MNNFINYISTNTVALSNVADQAGVHDFRSTNCPDCGAQWFKIDVRLCDRPMHGDYAIAYKCRVCGFRTESFFNPDNIVGYLDVAIPGHIVNAWIELHNRRRASKLRVRAEYPRLPWRPTDKGVA